MRKVKWIRRAVIIACLVLTPVVITGCMEVFKTQSEKDTTITRLETQVEEQKTAIEQERERLDGIVNNIAELLTRTENMESVTEEDAARWKAQVEEWQAQYNEGMDGLTEKMAKWEPLVASLQEAREKPTAAEAWGSIGKGIVSVLPYPYNMVGLSLLTGIVSAEGTRRRKNGQLEAVVESVAVGHDGNGGIDMQKVAKAQKAAGVQSLVDKMLENIEVKKVKSKQVA